MKLEKFNFSAEVTHMISTFGPSIRVSFTATSLRISMTASTFPTTSSRAAV